MLQNYRGLIASVCCGYIPVSAPCFPLLCPCYPAVSAAAPQPKSMYFQKVEPFASRCAKPDENGCGIGDTPGSAIETDRRLWRFVFSLYSAAASLPALEYSR
jgi:hypothetical protein